MKRHLLLGWCVGAGIALVAIASRYKSFGADRLGFALCPASIMWPPLGEWKILNKHDVMLVLIPLINGSLYAILIGVIVGGWKRRRWLSMLAAAVVVGWLTFIAVNYAQQVKLSKNPLYPF
jgi:hypothetical protein